MKKIIRKYYIYWTDEAFKNTEYAIHEAVYDIKDQGYTPLKIYIDKVSKGELLDRLIASTGKLKEPWMNLKTYLGLPVVSSKQLYITYA